MENGEVYVEKWSNGKMNGRCKGIRVHTKHGENHESYYNMDKILLLRAERESEGEGE